jgi:hypothetical protein
MTEVAELEGGAVMRPTIVRSWPYRGGAMRTSPWRSSPKFTKKNVINTAIERCARPVRRVGCNRCVGKRALREGVGQRPAFPLDLG